MDGDTPSISRGRVEVREGRGIKGELLLAPILISMSVKYDYPSVNVIMSV